MREGEVEGEVWRGEGEGWGEEAEGVEGEREEGWGGGRWEVASLEVGVKEEKEEKMDEEEEKMEEGE